MVATIAPLTIQKGETFRMAAYVTDDGDVVDLTGATARSQFREDVKSDVVLLDLTTENGGLVVTDATGGVIDFFVSDTDTSAISGNSGVYDLEIVLSGGDVYRVLEGRVSFTNEVTR